MIHIKYDWQLPSPLARAMGFEPQIHLARGDSGVVNDSKPHLIGKCKFAPLAVHVHTGCSAFPFYTATKPLIQLHIKYKTVFS